jgi:hypothetical protein
LELIPPPPPPPIDVEELKTELEPFVPGAEVEVPPAPPPPTVTEYDTPARLDSVVAKYPPDPPPPPFVLPPPPPPATTKYSIVYVAPEVPAFCHVAEVEL